MLERVAARLNIRGCTIRNVRTANLAASRRLHSAFWTHGGEALLEQCVAEGSQECANIRDNIAGKLRSVATNISRHVGELSAAASRRYEGPSQKQPTEMYAASAFGLDFLYPPKAVATFISLTGGPIRTRELKKRFVLYLPRSYSSLVGDSAAYKRKKTTGNKYDNVQGKEIKWQSLPRKGPGDIEFSDDGRGWQIPDGALGHSAIPNKNVGRPWYEWAPRYLDLRNPQDFDKTDESFDRSWGWLHRAPGAPLHPKMDEHPPEMRRRVWLGYISLSNRRIDIDRVIQTIENIPPMERRQVDVLSLVGAYLKIGEVRKALRALELLTESTVGNWHAGFESFIAYAINNRMWDMALLAWELLQRDRSGVPRYTMAEPKYIAGDVPDMVTHFVPWVRNLSQNDSLARDLALWLCYGVQSSFSYEESPFTQSDVDKIVGVLEERGWYLIAFKSFQDSIVGKAYDANHEGVLATYMKYRDHKDSVPTPLILDRVLQAAIALKDYQSMQIVFEDWFRYHQQPNKRAYQQIITAFAWQGESSICEDLFAEYSQRFQVDAPDLENMIRCYVERGEMANAVDRFQSMDQYGIEPTIGHYNALLYGFARAEDLEGATEYLTQMLNSDLEPTQRTYASMMYVCAARGDYENTETLFRAAGKSEIIITPAMWNMLVWSLVNGHNRPQAHKIINFVYTQNLGFGLTHMYNMLMTAYANHKGLQMCNRIFKEMKLRKVPFNYHTYGIMIRALSKTGHKVNLNRARQMLDMLHEEGVEPNSIPYFTLMQGYLRRRKYDDVFATYKLMLERKVPPSFGTQSLLIMASVGEARLLQTFTGRYDLSTAEAIAEHALKTFTGMDPTSFTHPKSAIPDNIFTPLIAAYLEDGDYPAVMATYRKYIEISKAQGAGGSQPSRHMLLKLMHASGQAGNWNGLRELWEIIFKEQKIKGRTLSQLRSGRNITLIHKHQMCAPLSILLRAAIDTVEDDIPSRDNPITVDDLAKYISDMVAWGFDLDGGTWNLLASVCAKTGDLQQAFGIVESVLTKPGGHMEQIKGQKRFEFMGPKNTTLKEAGFYPRVATLNALAGQLEAALHHTRSFSEEAEKYRAFITGLQKDFPATWKMVRTRRSKGYQASKDEFHEKLVDFVQLGKRTEPPGPKIRLNHGLRSYKPSYYYKSAAVTQSPVNNRNTEEMELLGHEDDAGFRSPDETFAH